MRPECARTCGDGRLLAPVLLWLACALAVGPTQARQQASSAPAPAPAAAAAAAPRTGDAWVDVRLADMEAYARRYPQAFVDELVRYFDAPRALVSERLAAGTTAGDVYYACAVARVTGRPCRSVLEAWDEAPGDGWAGVSLRLGIAPGSAEAKRLRQAFADSYRHWARPQPAPAGRPTRAGPATRRSR